MKKELIKQGLLDKHGKPNDKTPASYIATLGASTPSTPSTPSQSKAVADDDEDKSPAAKKIKVRDLI